MRPAGRSRRRAWSCVPSFAGGCCTAARGRPPSRPRPDGSAVIVNPAAARTLPAAAKKPAASVLRLAGEPLADFLLELCFGDAVQMARIADLDHRPVLADFQERRDV